MFDLKKYNGAMKKLTIAELILSAVTFFCILFLFVLPCFKASVSLDGISLDVLLLESENAEQKIFYDKVRAALRAEIANGQRSRNRNVFVFDRRRNQTDDCHF